MRGSCSQTETNIRRGWTNMRGTIIARGNSYRIKVPLGKDPATGKYTAYFETVRGGKALAEKRLRQLLTELDNGTFVKPGKTTVADYFESWLRDVAFPNMTPLTFEGYEYCVRKHIIPALGYLPIVDLKPQHLQRLYSDVLTSSGNKSGLSTRTVQYIHNTLHRALQNAIRIGVVARNVADAVEAPKVRPHEMRVMSEADIQIFLEHAQATPYYALFYLILFTGLRRSEALALRWCDCDLVLGQINVNQSVHKLWYGAYKGRTIFKTPKSKKGRRMISLSPSTAIVLREYRQAREEMLNELGVPIDETDLVFCHVDGSPFLPDTITHAWMTLARRVGLKGISLHSARHTHATLMLKQGIHPKIVQERLGHASVQITLDTYSHVAPGLQEAAAARFDEIVLPKQSIEELVPN